jgi:branched-chain amino acid transport system ATP-binding protein
MLEFNNISASYGKTRVLWDVSLRINEGEIVALVGSNGTGKSTLLKTMSGILRPSSGTITFEGKRIDRLPMHLIAEAGISHIPEGGKVFIDMTVKDNLDMGAYATRARRDKEETLKRVLEIFPILKERQGQLARTLSGGEQQMLAMGRGLMSKPKLCVFDEPSYGLAPFLVKEVFRVIKLLPQSGITVFLIEQNVRHTLDIADRAYILENGRIVMESSGQALLQDDHVRKAYLGL